MFWLMVVVLAVVVFTVFAVATGRGDAMTRALPDRAEIVLPDAQRLTAAELAGVRFALGFRGYRMDEVDGVLARAGAALEDRDARIAALERRLEAPGGGDGRA